MADVIDPRTGELTTANYGWTKPTVGASVDAWGGYLNTDLDGIDSVVHGIDVRPAYVLPTASTTVLGGVKVDGSTITIAGGVISGTPSSGPPVTISDTAPASPQVGALWFDSAGGQLYTWFNDGNSSQWTIVVNPGAGSSGTYLPLNGGALSGPVSGPSATFANLSAPQAIGDNRIINGDMRIDQRNNGASGTATGYTVDRWLFTATQASKITWGRNLFTAATPASFPYYFGLYASTAYTPIASDAFALFQAIEADMISDFAWGTANAQPVTLSFWFQSSLNGPFSGAIRNYATTRSYPFSFSYLASAGWQKIVVTIPGDTSGTWVMSGNAGSAYLTFDLGSGATYRGPANVWASANYVGVTGAASIMPVSNLIYLTGVKLEIGSVATPFNRQSLAKSMADCQRYFISLPGVFGSGYNVAGQIIYNGQILPVVMRANPTAALVAGSITNVVNCTSQGVSVSGSNCSFYLNMTVTATGQAYFQATPTFNAEL